MATLVWVGGFPSLGWRFRCLTGGLVERISAVGSGFGWVRGCLDFHRPFPMVSRPGVFGGSGWAGSIRGRLILGWRFCGVLVWLVWVRPGSPFSGSRVSKIRDIGMGFRVGNLGRSGIGFGLRGDRCSGGGREAISGFGWSLDLEAILEGILKGKRIRKGGGEKRMISVCF